MHYTHTHTHACMHMCMHTCIHTCTYMHACVHSHANTHTNLPVWLVLIVVGKTYDYSELSASILSEPNRWKEMCINAFKKKKKTGQLQQAINSETCPSRLQAALPLLQILVVWGPAPPPSPTRTSAPPFVLSPNISWHFSAITADTSEVMGPSITHNSQLPLNDDCIP